MLQSHDNPLPVLKSTTDNIKDINESTCTSPSSSIDISITGTNISTNNFEPPVYNYQDEFIPLFFSNHFRHDSHILNLYMMLPKSSRQKCMYIFASIIGSILFLGLLTALYNFLLIITQINMKIWRNGTDLSNTNMNSPLLFSISYTIAYLISIFWQHHINKQIVPPSLILNESNTSLGLINQVIQTPDDLELANSNIAAPPVDEFIIPVAKTSLSTDSKESIGTLNPEISSDSLAVGQNTVIETINPEQVPFSTDSILVPTTIHIIVGKYPQLPSSSNDIPTPTSVSTTSKPNSVTSRTSLLSATDSSDSETLEEDDVDSKVDYSQATSSTDMVNVSNVPNEFVYYESDAESDDLYYFNLRQEQTSFFSCICKKQLYHYFDGLFYTYSAYTSVLILLMLVSYLFTKYFKWDLNVVTLLLMPISTVCNYFALEYGHVIWSSFVRYSMSIYRLISDPCLSLCKSSSSNI